MERYIDADNFRKTMIKRFGCIPCLTDYSEASRYDIPLDDALNLAPTADVVPREEVVRILDEIEKTIRGALVLIGFSYKHNQKEMQLRKECYEDFLGYIAELKKKYEENQT